MKYDLCHEKGINKMLQEHKGKQSVLSYKDHKEAYHILETEDQYFLLPKGNGNLHH